MNNYVVDPKKVKVVPFGANIPNAQTINDIETYITRRKRGVIKLFFLGVDWYHKGGDVALRFAELLNAHGIPTELNVVGCIPPGNVPSFCKCHGFITEKNPKGYKKIRILLQESHFLILPSRAECYGLVFFEASSYGIRR